MMTSSIAIAGTSAIIARRKALAWAWLVPFKRNRSEFSLSSRILISKTYGPRRKNGNSRGPFTASFRPEFLFSGPKSTIFSLLRKEILEVGSGAYKLLRLATGFAEKNLEELKFTTHPELF
jgi:hypothetical protein